MDTPASTSHPRILEIESLRAIAAALVVLFRLVEGVSGGVGVSLAVAGLLVTMTQLSGGRGQAGPVELVTATGDPTSSAPLVVGL